MANRFNRKTIAAVTLATAAVDVAVQDSSRALTALWNDARTLADTYWKDEGASGKTLAGVRCVEAFLQGFCANAGSQDEGLARLARMTNGARSYELLASAAGFQAGDYTKGGETVRRNVGTMQAALDAIDADIVAQRKAAEAAAFNDACKAATGTAGTDRIQFVRC